MAKPRLSPLLAVSSLLAGVRLCLSDPQMRDRIGRALLINAVVFAALFAALVVGAFRITTIFVEGSMVAAAVGWAIRALIIVGYVLLAPAVFNVLAGLILPMIEGPLFLLARERAGGPPVPEQTGGLAATVTEASASVRRLMSLGLVTALVLPLNLFPGVGTLLYLVAQGLVSAHTLGWDLLAYHFELHQLDFDERVDFLRKNRLLVLTLGATATALCFVPFAQLLFASTNVAGAGVLSARIDQALGVTAPAEEPSGQAAAAYVGPATR